MNARQELQQEFNRIGKKPMCAIIRHEIYCDDGNIIALLKKGHTDQEFEEFMHDLDFDYDAGYGMQYIDGTVWFDDGTWLSRNEYDGSEWWVYLGTPKIPVDLLK
jgi:hypothetical protein